MAGPGRTGPAPRDPADRFAEKFAVRDDGCWEWIAGCNGVEYGTFKVGPKPMKSVLAHRWAYEHIIGPIPTGLELDHLCRNTRCVNPDHLEPVTHAENDRRGRRGALYIPPSTCRNGHPKDGRGRCDTCHRRTRAAITARYRAKKRKAA